MSFPELLAPAGSPKAVAAALAFGANAVYAGLPRYSLRVRENQFKQAETLRESIDYAHARNALFYVVCNIIAHNAKIDTLLSDLAPIIEAQPDALIVSDPGMIDLIRSAWPEMPLHLSVQANTVNWAGVKFWQKQGIRRVILSRELGLSEIKEIRQRCPDIELEVFVHGALCIAYSGRCLLSGYFNRRDPNQGACTNSCRWSYGLSEGASDASAPAADGTYFLEEQARPGEYMAISEDEHGTYILNSKDLRALEYMGELIDMGIEAFKIEGRTKSPYYVARACQAYRQAIDDYQAGRTFNTALLDDVESLANRGYTAGFYDRHADSSRQNYQSGVSMSQRGRYVGDVLSQDSTNGLLVEVKNKFACGQQVELIHPAGNAQCMVKTLQTERGESLSYAPGSGYRVWLSTDLISQNDWSGAFLATLNS